MKCNFLFILILNLLLAPAMSQVRGPVDSHVHLQDSATLQLGYRLAAATGQQLTHIDSTILDADAIITRLNKAGFGGAWIISNAYWFGSPYTPVDNEYDAVQQQNDWIAQQAAKYPGRLDAFMSVNPLKPYAIGEIRRCADTKSFRGIKMHFANSRIDLSDSVHLQRLREVFELANQYKLTVLLHLRSGNQWDGKAAASILVKHLIPLLNNTTLVLAHLGGWGGYDLATDEAMVVLTDYIQTNRKVPEKISFDISAVFETKAATAIEKSTQWDPVKQARKRLNSIGTEYILFGTDWPLTEIDEYIRILNGALGRRKVRKILNNHVYAQSTILRTTH